MCVCVCGGEGSRACGVVERDPTRQRLPTFLCPTILTHRAAVSYVLLPLPLTDRWTFAVHGSKAGKQLPPEQTPPGGAFYYTNKPLDGPSDLLSPESPTICVCNLGRGAFGGIVRDIIVNNNNNNSRFHKETCHHLFRRAFCCLDDTSEEEIRSTKEARTCARRYLSYSWFRHAPREAQQLSPC